MVFLYKCRLNLMHFLIYKYLIFTFYVNTICMTPNSQFIFIAGVSLNNHSIKYRLKFSFTNIYETHLCDYRRLECLREQLLRVEHDLPGRSVLVGERREEPPRQVRLVPGVLLQPQTGVAPLVHPPPILPPHLLAGVNGLV